MSKTAVGDPRRNGRSRTAVRGLVLAGCLYAAFAEYGSAARPADPLPAPPDVVRDYIGTHALDLALLEYDDQVAVYGDSNVNPSEAAWVRPFMNESYTYVKKRYSRDFGPDRLNVFLHQGRFGGGTIASRFDAFSGFKNTTDTGASSWVRGTNIDLLSHELCHIVEGSGHGVHESPAFRAWGDSKWGEFFQYDLYRGLGMEDDAQRVFDKFTATVDNFPRPGTRWFRDWFYPLWRDHGESRVMAKFFRLLVDHFPKVPENNGSNPIYTRRMTLGELVHFSSGAAGADLRSLATQAFGWTEETQIEYELALELFPGVHYDGRPAPPARPGTNIALLRPATSSALCGAAEAAPKAFNGSISGGNRDKWCSLAATKFVQVDLGAELPVHEIVIKHAGAGGESLAFNTRDYTVSASHDGVTFTPVATVTGNTLSRTTHATPGTTARFVRMDITAPTLGGGGAARIYELEIWGEGEELPRYRNLALHKPASATGSCAAAEGPEKAFNGSVTGGGTDKWCSTAVGKVLQVDLGHEERLDELVVHHAGAGGENAAFNTRDFEIQLSDNGRDYETVVSVTGNTESLTIHPIQPTHARYIRLNVLAPTAAGTGAARIYELEVLGGLPMQATPVPPTPTPTPTTPPSPSGNLALNKPATASAVCNAGETAAHAVDGSLATKWCDNTSASKWWSVDLGGNATVGGFVVKHAGAGGETPAWNTRDFNLETSLDGTTWSGAVNVAGSSANTTSHNITPRTARHVRLNVLMAEQAANTAARIYEVEVYSGAAPTPTPTPTPPPGTTVCGFVGDVMYLRVYSSPLSQWCVDSREWAAHEADYRRFFAYGDTVVTKLNALFAFTPSGLPLTYQATIPTGGASTGSSFGLGVTVTGDAFYGTFNDPVDGTAIQGFWGYLLTLHEAVNVWTGQVTSDWPTDWWADHRSPFPNSMDYQIMKVIGAEQNDTTLQRAALAQHRRMGVPGLPGFDSEVKMFDDFFDQYGGFAGYARVFQLIRADGLRWSSVSPNPSPLLSEYVMAYLGVGFGTRTDLTSTFVNAGVGTKDTQIPPYTVSATAVSDIATAHCSIVAATGDTTAALAALRRGDYAGARVPSTCSRCPSTTCACDTVADQCVAPWRGR